MKNKKPEIRFKGFSEEWVEHKFENDIVSIQTGTNLLGSTTNMGMPLLKMGNIQRGFFSLDKVEFLDENVEIEKENIAYYGDFFFNTRNTLELVGKGATWIGESGKFAFNNNIARFEFRGIDTVFFNYLYNTQNIISQVHARAMGTTSVAAIYPRNLNSIEYYLPKIQEQTQIGNFFKNLDNLITLHQRKYEKLGILKKAMLEKMFPKNGADVPEIRFKGFSEAWEEKTLGDLFGIASASRVHKHEWTESGVPFFRSSDVVSNYKGQENSKAFISFELYEELSKKSGRVQKNDILVTGGGSIGIPYLVKSNEPLYFKDADLLWLKNSDNLNGYFLYIFFSTVIFRDYINSITHTGTISHYTIEQAKATPIKVPKREEQEKIGNYFKNLDNLLILNHGELEKLKNLKKALLEKMFV